MKKVLIVVNILLASFGLSFYIYSQSNGPMGVERIARFTPLGYQSKIAEGNNQKKWLQVNLGGTQNVDSVKL